MKCQECGKTCAEGICAKCNEKIAQKMAEQLQKELEAIRKAGKQ